MPLSPRAHGAAAKAMFRSSCRLAITALAKRLARHISDIARAVQAAQGHDALDVAGGLVVIAALLVGDDDAERAVLARILQRRAHELDRDVCGVPSLT